MKQLIDLDFNEVSQLEDVIKSSKEGYSFESSVIFEDGHKVDFARGDLAAFIEGTFFNFDMDHKTFQDLIAAFPEFTDGLDNFAAKYTDMAIKAKIYENEFYWKFGVRKTIATLEEIGKNTVKIIKITY